MPIVEEGAAVVVTAEAGKALTIATDGECYVDRVAGLPDAQYASDRILGGSRVYLPRDTGFTVKIRAIAGNADYVVAYPAVPGSEVTFRRTDAGAIDALVYGGAALPIGPGATQDVSWGSITGKPTTLAGYGITDALPTSGGKLTGAASIIYAANNTHLWLGKYDAGTGHTNAPANLGAEAEYLKIGAREYGLHSYRLIGFGYVSAASDHSPAFVGYQELDSPGYTFGDLIFGTRATDSDTPPEIRLRITSDGQIKAEDTAYAPSSDESLTDKKYVDGLVNGRLSAAQRAAINALSPIADPPTATTEDIANAVNSVIAALQASGA